MKLAICLLLIGHVSFAARNCCDLIQAYQEIETYEYLLTSVKSDDLRKAITERLEYWYNVLDEVIEGKE